MISSDCMQNMQYYTYTYSNSGEDVLHPPPHLRQALVLVGISMADLPLNVTAVMLWELPALGWGFRALGSNATASIDGLRE